ncbi:putative NACHT domain-containing protein [Seiridium cardinale]|uniref:NACHT domain-containing protein n=1 Tax=Seiridium cardinale TaxID=138064 RepID=A0ABR2XFS8_9PEZI
MRTGWVYVCALYIAFEALNDPAMLCSCVALLAPTLVDFFSSDDQRLGDKRSLEQSVHNITPIAIDALYDDPLSKYTIAERISWGRGRQTTRGEDKGKRAFKRLHRAIQADQDILVRDPELEKSLDECLADLRLSDPQDDKSRIEATKGGLFRDTYRWVLENPDYKKWRCDQESRLL